MSLYRRVQRAGPVRAEPIVRPSFVPRETLLGRGSLACPQCDAPVTLAGRARPSDRIDCPYCAHAGALRDFLELGEPTRPTHVVVHLVPERG